MKKIALSLATLAVCSLSFTACEDVPAPYEINGEGGTTTGSTIINESFSQSLGSFTALNTVGDIPWVCSHGCAQITSYVDTDGDGQKENLAAESWLISPKMNFTSVDSAYVSFEYILRYANANEVKDNYQVLVSKDYTGIPTNASWTALSFNATQGSDWDTWYESGKLQIPAEFMKQPNVTLALRYKADKKAATWEVKNLIVKQGKSDDSTNVPAGGNIIANSGFETWTNNLPEGWKSTTTASSAELAQSTDAHTGSYSLLVKCNESQNKRLGSKEYTLKAGSYKMSLFVKGEGQVRPGYTLIGEDGKIPSQNGYMYGDYTATTANEWTEVTYSFKLDAQTKVNFVMMNPKSSDHAKASDKLVDDFTVTTADGGLVEEGGTTPEPEKPQVGGDILNETFANGQGKFTIEDKLLPAGASYIWKADTQYGYMKASAFINGESLESESWLISPVVDLAASANPTLTFDHVANKGEIDKMAEQNMLYIKAEGGEWTKMDITTYSPGNDWKAWTTSVQSLAAYKGKKIQFAFVYKTPKGSSGTWEVKNVVVK